MEAERPPLLAFLLGTLHAALLMLALALLAYEGDGLAPLLGGLGTTQGLALFAWLWLLSCWGTRSALREIPIEAPPRAFAADAIGRGALWGGAVGAAFLLGVLLVLALVGIARAGFAGALGFAFFGVFAMAGACTVGLFVGAALSALDLALLLAARRLA